MRPVPRKLALMMSVAGLGLSFGELAHARSDAASGRLVANLGVAGRQDVQEPDLPGPLDRPIEEALDGALDAPDESVVAASNAFFRKVDLAGVSEKRTADSAVAPVPASRVSEEDRAALALAMVLMTESFSSTPGDPPGVQSVAARAHETVAAKKRLDERDTTADDALAAQWAEALGRSVAPQHATVADAPLRAPANADVETARGPSAQVEAALPLDLRARPDVDLDPAAVDIALEFADARFAVVESPAPADIVDAAPVERTRPETSIALELDLDLNLGAQTVKGGGVHAGAVDIELDLPSTSLVEVESSSLAVESAHVPALRYVGRPDIVLDNELAAADSLTPTTPSESGPRIVVATHAERALRSLEALLGNDGAASGRFGARTDEIFVTSEAEKTRLTLSMKRQGLLGSARDGESARAVADEPVASDVSAVALAPSSALNISPLLDGELAMTSAGEPAQAALDPERRSVRSALGGEMLAVSEVGLDRVRGGFETNTGLQISFGIDRAVYINGNLVTTTSLNIAAGGRAGALPMPVSTDSMGTVSSGSGPGTLTIVQNGAGNVVHTGPISAANLGTVVQNTLNDQKIQSITAINATVNSLQVLKAQSLESSLRGALIDSLRR